MQTLTKTLLGGTVMAATSALCLTSPAGANAELQAAGNVVNQPITKSLCYTSMLVDGSIGTVDWIIADSSGIFTRVAQVSFQALKPDASVCSDPNFPIPVTMTWTPTQAGTYTSKWCLKVYPLSIYYTCNTAETVTVIEMPEPGKPSLGFTAKKRSIKLIFEADYASSYRVTLGKKQRTVTYTKTTFTGLKPGTRYKACVVAINDKGESAPRCLRPVTRG